MWLFSETGFVSIVAHDSHDDLLLVRARRRKDLIGFLKHCSHSKTYLKRIRKTPDADYAYRVNVKRDIAAVGIADIVSDIPYTNFKDYVHDGSDRDWVYLNIWMESQKLDPDYPTKYFTGSAE